MAGAEDGNDGVSGISVVLLIMLFDDDESENFLASLILLMMITFLKLACFTSKTLPLSLLTLMI